jgi:lipopolysaccharide export system permease protein
MVYFNVLTVDANFHLKQRISAQYARWVAEEEVMLMDGFIRDFDENNSPIGLEKFTEKVYRIPGGKDFFSKRIVVTDNMNIKELREYIQHLDANEADSRKYRANLWYKYSFPLASLVMVLIAIPFSFMMGNKGALFGIGIAIGISVIFWFTFAVFRSFGANGVLSPFLSAFAPIIVFMGVSIYLYVNVKT